MPQVQGKSLGDYEAKMLECKNAVYGGSVRVAVELGGSSAFPDRSCSGNDATGTGGIRDPLVHP